MPVLSAEYLKEFGITTSHSGPLPGFVYGQHCEPTFKCDCTSVYPCLLHLIMGTFKQIFRSTLELTLSTTQKEKDEITKGIKAIKLLLAETKVTHFDVQKQINVIDSKFRKDLWDAASLWLGRCESVMDQSILHAQKELFDSLLEAIEVDTETVEEEEAQVTKVTDGLKKLVEDVKHYQVSKLKMVTLNEKGDTRKRSTQLATLTTVKIFTSLEELYANWIAKRKELEEVDRDITLKENTYDVLVDKEKKIRQAEKAARAAGDVNNKAKNESIKQQLIDFLRKNIGVYIYGGFKDKTVVDLADSLSYNYDECKSLLTWSVEMIKKQLVQLWDLYAYMLVTAQSDDHTVDEDKWREIGIEFGAAYQQIFPGKTITSYMHTLIAHLGLWMQSFGGSLERLANFGIENRHKFIKIIVELSNHQFKSVMPDDKKRKKKEKDENEVDGPYVVQWKVDQVTSIYLPTKQIEIDLVKEPFFPYKAGKAPNAIADDNVKATDIDVIFSKESIKHLYINNNKKINLTALELDDIVDRFAQLIDSLGLQAVQLESVTATTTIAPSTQIPVVTKKRGRPAKIVDPSVKKRAPRRKNSSVSTASNSDIPPVDSIPNMPQQALPLPTPAPVKKPASSRAKKAPSNSSTTSYSTNIPLVPVNSMPNMPQQTLTSSAPALEIESDSPVLPNTKPKRVRKL
eukprot:gene8477-9969_t